MGPIKMNPSGFTCYDKVVIDEDSMTVQQVVDWLAEHHKIDVSAINSGKIAIYQSWDKNAPERLPKKVEDIYRELAEEEFAGRYFMVLVISGTLKEGGDEMEMPPVKYCFKKRGD